MCYQLVCPLSARRRVLTLCPGLRLCFRLVLALQLVLALL
jgi:hypothetical protein